MEYEVFINELSKRREKVYDYLGASRFRELFRPDHIRNSVYSYVNQGGKSLRPALLLFSCGAVGGDEAKAIPAAAAIEVFHTWTMVHDDIIDRDTKRRGGPTVHEEFRKRAINEFDYDESEAAHYGISIAMLAGDMQQGWAVSILSELPQYDGIDPNLVLYLIRDSEMRVQSTLIEGQVLDIQYSKFPIDSLHEEQIVDMLWKKTGVLYEFASKAGAMLGLNTSDPDHPLVKAVSSFASKCGIAFQLQDDILGIVGNEKMLGKPVGSDIREGKRTTILYHAFKNADSGQRSQLMRTFGNEQADDQAIEQAKTLLRELGGIENTKELAISYVKDSLIHLDKLPPSKYKDLLSLWAEYMIEREF
ncbi:polyprenyl synthetase family protein [Candidatus Poribacteria bacterium]